MAKARGRFGNSVASCLINPGNFSYILKENDPISAFSTLQIFGKRKFDAFNL